MKTTTGCLILLLVLINVLNAQETVPPFVKSSKTETINGKKYYIHTVQKGETLYRIAKNYEVSIDELKQVNPDLTESLQLAQTIKIPVIAGGVSDKKDIKPAEKIISSANTVMIKDTFKLAADKSPAGTCNIALMLPLYLNNTADINVDNVLEIKEPWNYKSFAFIQFYEGFVMAIDSVQSKGLTVRLYVYDVDEDSVELLKVLQKPELKKMDIIIGPLFKKCFMMAAEFSKKHNIKIVSPLTQGNEILINNPHVFKVTPSVQTQLKQLALFITNNYKNENVIIVHNNRESEDKMFAMLESKLNEVSPGNKFYKDVIYNQAGIGGLTALLSASKENVLITLSNEEVFISNYVRKLTDISEDYKITVFGLHGWMEYENLEVEYLQRLNLHMFSPDFIDYDKEMVKSFVKSYRDKYKTEPAEYAFLGYDIACYFLNVFMNHGKKFETYLPALKVHALQSAFEFQRENENNGFENSYLNIYKYENYKMKLMSQ